MRLANIWSFSIRYACCALVLTLLLAPRPSTAAEKPAIRTITAFVKLDRTHYKTQIQETLSMLDRAKTEFENKGYKVQYIRVTTQPFSDYTKDLTKTQALEFFKTIEALMPKERFMASIGPAMISETNGLDDVEILKEVLPNSLVLYSSIIVATEKGVDWKAVKRSAELIKYLADNSKQSEANFAFAASALIPLKTPYFPVSYHTGDGREFAVGLASANLVREAFQNAKGDRERAKSTLQSTLNEHAQSVERISQDINQATGWDYLGLDTSIAPGFSKNESVGAAIEELIGTSFGSSGTLAAAALITEVIHAIPVKQIGYSGLMLPVMEDEVLSARWSERKITADMLLAYSAVCGTGLDTVPLPGDVSFEQLERMIGDMATLAVKLHKPLAARLMPIAGKKEGDFTEFDWLLKTKIQPLP